MTTHCNKLTDDNLLKKRTFDNLLESTIYVWQLTMKKLHMTTDYKKHIYHNTVKNLPMTTHYKKLIYDNLL